MKRLLIRFVSGIALVVMSSFALSGVTEAAIKSPVESEVNEANYVSGATAIDLQVTGDRYNNPGLYYNGSDWKFSYNTGWYNSAGYWNSSWDRFGNAYRFVNAGIPQGADVVTAYMIFHSRSARAGEGCNTVIVGYAHDDSPMLDTMEKYRAARGTVCGGATDDNLTSASVLWDNIPPWEAGEEYRSPELGEIIQEIVNRPDWVSGNALTLWWDDHGHNTTNVNVIRMAESLFSNPQYAARLHVEFVSSATTLASISPLYGSNAGNESVTLKGANFQSVDSVFIGGEPCSDVVVVDPGTIVCDTPALEGTGSRDVSVGL